MSEFLEKLEQPELTVTPSGSPLLVEEAAEVHAKLEVNKTAGKAAGKAADEAANQTTASTVAEHLPRTSKNPNPDSLETITSIHSDANWSQAASAKTPKGIVRHRMITGSCMTLSLAILSLCAFDLRGLIDKQGVLDTNLKFTAVQKKVSQLPPNMRSDDSTVSEGLRKVQAYSDDNYGFADEDGTVVLPAIYSDAGLFHDGLAAVKFRGDKAPKTGNYPQKELQKWAYINKLGETVLPPAYSEAGQFNDGVAPIAIDGHGALINKKGEMIGVSKTSSAPAALGNFYEVSAKDFRSGVMNNTGKFVVPPIYDRIEHLDQTKATMHRIGRSYRNKLASSATSTNTSSSQYFKVYLDGKCGLADTNGELLIPIKYENIASFNKGHAVVLKK